MIHFDTNALIALPLWARESHPVVQRVAEGEPAAVCSVVWYEYLIGPIETAEIKLASAFLQGRIDPVNSDDAALAAKLYNAASRRRPLKTNALIAAAAIGADACFVTVNSDDFQPFIDHGLKLLPAAV